MLEPENGERVNAPYKMADVVKLITEVGPDITLISKISGVHKETVRYWYKEKIVGKGMAVQAIPNEAALGLKRVAVKLRVAETFHPYIQPTFLAMNDLSFAAAFEKAMPEGYYFLHATMPEKFFPDYGYFITNLEKMGIFESAELYEFDWFKRAPMHAQHYDFDASRWDYDWQNPLPVKEEEMRPKSLRKVRLDKIDLLILKELQRNASVPLTEINRAIGAKDKIELNYKTLDWHFRAHVIERGLIDGYSIRWLGTRYNQLGEHLSRKYLVVNVVVKRVSDSEFLELTENAHRTPFLWSEMRGKDYLAQFAFPIAETNDAFEYLRKILGPFAGRASHYVVDQRNAAQFVLPYNSWSDSEKEWRFEKDNALVQVGNLFLSAKNGSAIAT